MIRAFGIVALLALAACGADGPPEPVETGVSISGEIRVGIGVVGES